MFAALSSLAAFFNLGGQPGLDFSLKPADSFPTAKAYRLREGSRLDAGIDWGTGQPDSLLYLPTAQDG
jgi:hypothetical protein